MDLWEECRRFGIALGLGLIVGLQRERAGHPLAGFRTFPLVTLFGAVAALLSLDQGGWVLAGGMVAMAALIIIGNLTPQTNTKPGVTTEAAMLVMYGAGALIMGGEIAIAAIISGSVAVLLHLKPQMHSVARRLEDPDFKAIMQFVLISLVILPILPNKSYGPYQVLNPHKIWLMVVLIVGINVAGYIIYKFWGRKVGTLAGGVLGGLISSTATTVSFSRRSAQFPEASGIATLIIMVASTVVFLRVLIIIGTVEPRLMVQAGGPIGTMLVLMATLALIFWRTSKRESAELPEQGNPSELRTALIFAALYALILLAVAAAKARFGAKGLYVVSILSGLTDMDAITLSISEMVQRKEVSPGIGWRLVMTAALSNLIFKTGVVAFLGSRRLLARVCILFGISLAAGGALIFLWPA
jgi:uncharacterized membrane protein (DUF4010 family)